MIDNNQEESKEIIHMDYDEQSPIFQKIRKEFISKLKDKYQCEDYESIVDYVFNFVFKKKYEKSKCIENLNSVFNNKASGMIDYLFQLVKDAQNEHENNNNLEEKTHNYNYRKGGKYEKYKTKGRSSYENKKYYKNKQRERSRSYSKERSDKYENYQKYPVPQKGFYPPKGRFGGPMMPMGGAYPPYYPPQMMPAYNMR